MSRGIIYVMTTVVPGLIKIGKTRTRNFEQCMNNLEYDGYRNVTGLKRAFAIEVDEYDEKEALLHNIFEKSRLSDTELFAVDINTVTQLLSAFDGTVIFPEKTKDAVFNEAAETRDNTIPDGEYYFERKKKSENNRIIKASALIKNGEWTLLKGSVLATSESKGISAKAKEIRQSVPIRPDGVLTENFYLGEVLPSLVSNIVLYGSSDGWVDWVDKDGRPLDYFRKPEDK